MSRLENAWRTPQAAGARSLSAWRKAGLCARAMASARDKLAGTGCWLRVMAGHTASPADNSRYLMGFLGPVVRSSPHTRHVRHGFRAVTRGVGIYARRRS